MAKSHLRHSTDGTGDVIEAVVEVVREHGSDLHVIRAKGANAQLIERAEERTKLSVSGLLRSVVVDDGKTEHYVEAEIVDVRATPKASVLAARAVKERATAGVPSNPTKGGSRLPRKLR